jgi:hypothetical protein
MPPKATMMLPKGSIMVKAPGLPPGKSRRAQVRVGVARQTRATQQSPPSGRLVSNCGDVSP